MATHKLFVQDTNGKKRVIGSAMSTTYTYDADTKTLKVFWKSKKPVVLLQGIVEGTPIWVNCNGGIPEVRKIKLPRRKADCLAWLLDFPKAVRTHSEEKYESLLEKQRQAYGWWGYEEYTQKEKGLWALTLCNRSDCGGVHHIACFISDKAAEDKESVKAILKAWSELRWMYYPKAFVQSVLRDRFGFSETDLEDVDAYLGDK